MHHLLADMQPREIGGTMVLRELPLLSHGGDLWKKGAPWPRPGRGGREDSGQEVTRTRSGEAVKTKVAIFGYSQHFYHPGAEIVQGSSSPSRASAPPPELLGRRVEHSWEVLRRVMGVRRRARGILQWFLPFAELEDGLVGDSGNNGSPAPKLRDLVGKKPFGLNKRW